MNRYDRAPYLIGSGSSAYLEGFATRSKSVPRVACNMWKKELGFCFVIEGRKLLLRPTSPISNLFYT